MEINVPKIANYTLPIVLYHDGVKDLYTIFQKDDNGVSATVIRDKNIVSENILTEEKFIETIECMFKIDCKKKELPKMNFIYDGKSIAKLNL